MPELRTYRLFISHSWAHGDAYETLVNFFNGQRYFDWKNYSIPKDNPIHTTSNDAQLYTAIKNKIARVHCVVMPTGVYAAYSKWIKKEIKISNNYDKPIIAVEGWGAQRTSQEVKDNACEIVRWQSKSIVDAIRRNAI